MMTKPKICGIINNNVKIFGNELRGCVDYESPKAENRSSAYKIHCETNNIFFRRKSAL